MKRKPSPSAAGTALRALRESAGMTLQQVADAAGVSLSYLSRAENGDVAPSPTWFSMVGTVLGAAIQRQDEEGAAA